jgi:hypothetical protein
MMTNLEISVYFPFVHNNSSGGIDCS